MFIDRRCGYSGQEFHYTPNDFKDRDGFADCSKRQKEAEGSMFCTLPFSNTVEAEAMGAEVNFQKENDTPRIPKFICSSLDEVLALPDIDYDSGRIGEILSACRLLKERGENVLYELSGPLTILNGLIDISIVLKAVRKQPDKMKEIYRKMEDELIKFAGCLVDAGVRFISYADPVGTKEILGQKTVKRVMEDFTSPFLKRLKEEVQGEFTVILCPKAGGDLVDAGMAVIEEIKTKKICSYAEACIEVENRADIICHMCIHKEKMILKDQKINILRLA